MSSKNEISFTIHLHRNVKAVRCQTLSKLLFFFFFFFPTSLPLSCVDSDRRKCEACSETPEHGLVDSIITLKDENKGTRIICCHTPILINNSMLECAVSPVKIRICLKAMMARGVWLAASQLRPLRVSSMDRNLWKERIIHEEMTYVEWIHPSDCKMAVCKWRWCSTILIQSSP